MRLESEARSLERRLAEAEENLRLLHERKSEFVQQTDIPLQLIKDERRLEQEIETLRAQLAQVSLPPSQEKVPPLPSRLRAPRMWTIITVWVVVAAALAIGGTVLARFALRPPPSAEPRATPSPSVTASPTPSPPASPTRAAPSSSPALFLNKVHQPLPDGCVRAISLASGSGVLAAVDNVGIIRAGSQKPAPGNPGDLLSYPLAVAEGPDGRLWVGTFGNGLVELTPEGEAAGIYTQTTDGADIAVVGAVELDEDGRVWVGTATEEPGVYVLDRGHWYSYPWSVEGKYPVRDIELERKERVWVATFGGGVRCLDLTTRTWSVYNQLSCTEGGACLPCDDVFAIHIATDGRKWVGTDVGLGVLDDRHGTDKITWQAIDQDDGLLHSRVVALAEDNREHVIVGTEEGLERGGLNVIDQELKVVAVQYFSHSVSALTFDPRQDRLWVGTLGEGLSVWAIEESYSAAP